MSLSEYFIDKKQREWDDESLSTIFGRFVGQEFTRDTAAEIDFLAAQNDLTTEACFLDEEGARAALYMFNRLNVYIETDNDGKRRYDSFDIG